MREFELRKGLNPAFPYEARIGAVVRMFASEDDARRYLMREGCI